MVVDLLFAFALGFACLGLAILAFLLAFLLVTICVSGCDNLERTRKGRVITWSVRFKGRVITWSVRFAVFFAVCAVVGLAVMDRLGMSP